MFERKTIWLGNCLVGPSLLKRRNDALIAVLFSPDGKISMGWRPGINTIRCDMIVSKLDGGGNSYAAGAIIRERNNDGYVNDYGYGEYDNEINSTSIQLRMSSRHWNLRLNVFESNFNEDQLPLTA
jgi:hypothetical protein